MVCKNDNKYIKILIIEETKNYLPIKKKPINFFFYYFLDLNDELLILSTILFIF